MSKPAVDVATDSAAGAFGESVWRSDLPSPVHADSTAPAPAVFPEDEVAGLTPISILAGAGAALVGGLVWAGVVVVTRYDIGILAWLIGAATGLAMVRVSGRALGVAGRTAAAVFAAGGIMVGKYVIFVHAIRTVLGAQLAAQGISVNYLDTQQVSILVHNFGSIVRPMYALWVALAVFAAVRTASGQPVFKRRK